MGRILIFGGVAALLSACTGTAEPITLRDGAKGYHVQCSGIQRSWDDCTSEAREVCPAGYDVVFTFKGEPGSGVYQYQRAIDVRCKV